MTACSKMIATTRRLHQSGDEIVKPETLKKQTTKHEGKKHYHLNAWTEISYRRDSLKNQPGDDSRDNGGCELIAEIKAEGFENVTRLCTFNCIDDPDVKHTGKKKPQNTRQNELLCFHRFILNQACRGKSSIVNSGLTSNWQTDRRLHQPGDEWIEPENLNPKQYDNSQKYYSDTDIWAGWNTPSQREHQHHTKPDDYRRAGYMVGKIGPKTIKDIASDSQARRASADNYDCTNPHCFLRKLDALIGRCGFHALILLRQHAARNIVSVLRSADFPPRWRGGVQMIAPRSSTRRRGSTNYKTILSIWIPAFAGKCGVEFRRQS